MWRRLLSAVVAVGLFVGFTAAPVRATDDSLFELQWALAELGAPDAWVSSRGGGITIGIVDTGVDPDHPDLKGKIDAFADCVGGPCRVGSGRDRHGHGTLVAGIAAAAADNGRGIAGLAPDARLVVARAVDTEGRGSIDDIANGIRWVIDQGAQVVNLSLGDPNFLFTTLLGSPLAPSIELAWSRGAIPVLAAGNENVGLLGLGSSNYGNLNAVIVGANGPSGSPASYSSPIGNAKWGLVAPGGSGGGPPNDILSTFPGGEYAWAAGTSMAAPHVAGALALLLAQGLGRQAAIDRLLSTADRSVDCGGGCAGRLDVRAAVGSGPVVTSPRPTVTQPPQTTAAPTTAATTTTPPTVPAVPVVTSTSPQPSSSPQSQEPATSTTAPDSLAAGPFDPVSDDGTRLGSAAVLVALASLVAVSGGLAVVTHQRLTGVGRW